MIFDKLANAALYFGAHPKLAYAFELAKTLMDASAPYGRHDGEEGVYVMKSTYETKVCEGEATYEAHREYIDLQILVKGSEKILDCDLDDLKITQPYTPDCLLGVAKDGTREQTLVLGEGSFAIFYPTDAHAPGLAAGESASVVKLVAKIPVEE